MEEGDKEKAKGRKNDTAVPGAQARRPRGRRGRPSLPQTSSVSFQNHPIPANAFLGAQGVQGYYGFQSPMYGCQGVQGPGYVPVTLYEQMLKRCEQLERDRSAAREERAKLKRKLKKKTMSVRRLEGKVEELKMQLATVDELKNELAEVKRMQLKTHNQALLGSIAFTYIRRAVRYVLGPGHHDVKSIEVLQAKCTSEEEKRRLASFVNAFWEEGFVQVLRDFKDERLDIAHPHRLANGNLPDPTDLDRIVQKHYVARSEREKQHAALRLIEKIDVLKSQLGCEGLLANPRSE